MKADILRTIVSLPAVQKALGDQMAALVRRRQALLADRARIEREGEARRTQLYLERCEATAARQAAELAYLEACRTEAAASYRLDGDAITTQRQIAEIDGSLVAAGAGDAGVACVELVRQLRAAHGRRRVSPVPTVTETMVRETRDGPRKEVVLVADLAGRASELRSLLDAAREVEKLPTMIADPAEILARIEEFRNKFCLPGKPAEVAA